MSSKAYPLSVVFALMMCFSFSSIGQNYPGIKKGEIIPLTGSKYVLVKHKKKTGLYNITAEQFVVKPDNSFFYYVETYNYLFRLDKDGIVSAYDLQRNDTTCFIAAHKGELVFDKTWAGDYVGCIIPAHDTLTSKTIPAEAYCDFYFKMPSAGLRVIDNSMIIYEYAPRIVDPLVRPLKSLVNVSADSIIFNPTYGEFEPVYPPDIPAVTKSGVQSIETGEWQIEPKYENIYFDHNYFICLFYLDYGWESDIENEIYFDIYKKEGDQIIATEYMGIKSNREFPAQLFSQHELTIGKDSTFYYSKSKVGKGIKSLFLYDDAYNMDYSLSYRGYSHFSNETIFEPKYDFVHKLDHDYKYLVAYNDNGFELVQSTKGDIRHEFLPFPMPIKESLKIHYKTDTYELYYVVDGKSYVDTSNNGYFDLKDVDQPNVFTDNYFGLEKIGDSLIYLKYFVEELIDPYPYHLTDEYGEPISEYDSTTGYYEFVYLPNEPGFYGSGIYDLTKQKWLISPDKAWILKTYGGFLISQPVLDEAFNLVRYEYSFQNNEGVYLFENISEKELNENKSYQRFFVPNYKVDELELINPYFSDFFHYFKSNGKKGIVNLNKMKIVNQPASFIYRHWDTQGGISIDKGILRYKNIVVDTTFNLMDFQHIELFAGNHSLAIQTNSTNETKNFIYEHFSETVYHQDSINKTALDKYMTKEMEDKSTAFNISQINDSLLYIEDWFDDYQYDTPMMSSIYPDEDSIILNEQSGFYEAVYPADIPGHYHSGIYNFVNDKWFIPAENRIVVPYQNEYILFVPTLDNLGITIGYTFSVVNTKGETVLEEKEFSELAKAYQDFLIQKTDLLEIRKELNNRY